MLDNKKYLKPFLFFLMTLIIGIGIYIFIKQKELNTTYSEFEYEDNVAFGVPEGVNYDEMLLELQKRSEEAAIAYSINATPNLISSSMNLLFANIDGNNKDLVIEITDDKTNKSIFKSKAIKEGTFLEFVDIKKNYEKGIHSVTAHITAFNKENHKKIGETAAQLQIYVNAS